MIRKELVLTLALTLLLLLTACSTAADTMPTATAPAAMETAGKESAAAEMSEQSQSPAMSKAESMVEESTEMADHNEDMAQPSEEMDAAASADQAMTADLPAWQTLPLTDARTGESFTLADFAGRAVFVEPMATWCGNCRQQLRNVAEARAQLTAEDVVFIALSVETTIDAPTLAGYAEREGFDWLFAVPTPDMLSQLAAEFGQTIANPPATPHFIIRPDGSFTGLMTGIDPADQIVSHVETATGS